MEGWRAATRGPALREALVLAEAVSSRGEELRDPCNYRLCVSVRWHNALRYSLGNIELGFKA